MPPDENAPRDPLLPSYEAEHEIIDLLIGKLERKITRLTVAMGDMDTAKFDPDRGGRFKLAVVENEHMAMAIAQLQFIKTLLT